MVKRVEDYPYSSAKAHLVGVIDEVLGEELFQEGQRKDYVEFIRTGIPEKERSAKVKYLFLQKKMFKKI